MAWKKRRKNPPTQPQPQSLTPKAVATPSEIPPVVKSLMEEAADRVKTELTTTGRIRPKAFFLYDEESPGSTSKIVTVTLSVRSEEQREALRKRVRDKAAAEGARAVVIVHDIRAKQLSMFGVMAETRITASINYVFSAEKKTIERWDMQWNAV
jgi:hypothetical protein